MFEKKVIDISHWNGKLDFESLKKQGIWGVIIKIGGSETSDGHTYQDKMFEDYYIQAKKSGLHVGCYYFGVGSNYSKGCQDGLRCLEMLKGRQFDLPIYLDYETYKGNEKKNKAGNTAYVRGFCHTIEERGYFVGVYGSDISTFKELIDKNLVIDYSWWVARYNTKGPTYAKENNHLWQYTSTGKFNGHSCRFDVNKCYLDFPTIIIKKGLNGYGK